MNKLLVFRCTSINSYFKWKTAVFLIALRFFFEGISNLTSHHHNDSKMYRWRELFLCFYSYYGRLFYYNRKYCFFMRNICQKVGRWIERRHFSMFSILWIVFDHYKRQKMYFFLADLPGWEKSRNRSILYYMSPHENTAIIEPLNLCVKNDQILLLIVIISSADNFKLRYV